MFRNRSLFEQIVAWFLMAGVWILWTAGCGAMLVLQDAKMNARPAAVAAACNEAAAAAVEPNDSPQPLGPELAHGTRGLRVEYLASPSARASYAFCLEDRDRWPPSSARERKPAS